MRWRGAMLDISRHFFDAEFIKKTISALAIFDYNTLHLHLTDDQGWRYESKVFPALHEIGSHRKQSQNNHGLLTPTFDGLEHYGFLTQLELKEIIDHAAALGIQVIPEINIPGHTGALLSAFPQFGINQVPVEVSGQWGISEYLLRPFPETFDFLTKVFEEVATIFPSDYIHVGGDESLIKNWLNDSEVVTFMKENFFASPKDLFIYFMKEVEKIITRLGKKMVTWDDAFAFDPKNATNAVVMSWRGSAIAKTAMEFGREVVQGPVFPTYFDYSQEVSPNEPLAIGGPVTLDDVLNFAPLPGVMGVQFQLWTEYIQSPKHAEYMMWPRAAALAFRCWGDSDNFLDYFNARKEGLQNLGITIRALEPGEREKVNHLGIGLFHPGFQISEIVETLEKSAIEGEVATFNN